MNDTPSGSGGKNIDIRVQKQGSGMQGGGEISLQEQIGQLPREPSATRLRETSGRTRSTFVLDRVIRWCVYVLAAGVPLLFTPFTSEAFELSKITLIFALSVIAALAWAGKMITSGSVRISRTVLDIPLLAYFGLFTLAAIFSVDRVQSFLGTYGRYSGSFIQLLPLVLLFFVVVNNFDARKVRHAMEAFLGSALIVEVLALYAIFAFNLAGENAFFFPWAFSRFAGFHTVSGTLAPLGMLAVIVILLLLAAPPQHSGNQIHRGVLFRSAVRIAGIFISLVLIFLLNLNAIFYILLLSVALVLAFRSRFLIRARNEGVSPGNGDSTRSAFGEVLPFIVLAFAGAFVVFQFLPVLNLRTQVPLRTPAELSLRYQAITPVITEVIKTRPLLGTGPATFGYAFARYRDRNINDTVVWNLRFDKANSELVEQLVTGGLLTGFAFELVWLVLLFFGIRYSLREEGNGRYPLLVVFASLWIYHFFSFFTSTLAFLFFLSAAFILAQRRTSESVQTATTPSPRTLATFSFTFSLSAVIAVTMLVFVGIAYAADILFAKARTRVAAGDVEGARDFLLRASSLNPYRDVYLRELSGIFLVQASIAAGEQVRLPQDQRDPSAVQVPVTAAVRAATAARDLAPRQAPNWINLAATYRGVAQFASNSEPFVTVALERAVELEPQSPFLHTELGKSYNQQAQAMLAAVESDATRLSEESQKTLSDLRQKAIAEFRRAQALKQDYLDSFYQEALLAERERNYEQALSIMGNLSQDYPQQLDVTFEYGRMLYNAGRVDDSAVQFQKVISFVPTSANAHYGLGFAYWRRGEFAKAQAEFEAVLKVDPNNVNVQNHLADVRAGRSITSASFVAPEPPALEQQPSSQP